jgi:O-antigen ligase
MQSESRNWIYLLQTSPHVFAAYFGLHAVLGVVFRTVPGASMLHAGLTFVLGAIYCLMHRKVMNWVYLVGYLTAAEVLWKMTQGLILWEQGKYFGIAVLTLAIVTTRRFGNIPAMAQLALLVPSSVMTCLILPPLLAKDCLSFNMSGPLLLCFASVFLAAVEIEPRQLTSLFLLMAGPIFAIAVVTVYNMANAPIELVFENRSNYFVTGGFGPNQVSAALGLGIFLGFFVMLTGKLPVLSRSALGCMVLLMMSQAAFTFSRNGVLSGIGAALLTLPFLVTNPRLRTRILIIIPLVALLAVLVVFPFVDDVTGGMFTNRIENTSGTGRESILAGELELWKENPIFGVGPGLGRYVRGDAWEAAAHTEFSRLLAEHGVFGLAALILYPILFFNAFLSADSSLHKALTVSAMGWAVVFMCVNAMRMAAPGFMFGLAFAKIGADPIRAVAAARSPIVRKRTARYIPATARGQLR